MKSSSILIIDDSQTVRQLMEKILRKAYDFHEAADGISGVKKAVDLRPDLIIIDLTMPDIGGIEAMHRIKARIPNQKVLIFSEKQDKQTIDRVRNSGAYGFLPKPVQPKNLVEILENIFSQDEPDSILIKSKSIKVDDDDFSDFKGLKKPYTRHQVVCPACGFEKVVGYKRIPESATIEWDIDQIIPIYKPTEGYAEFDFKRINCTVCPLCLFSSSDLGHFNTIDLKGKIIKNDYINDELRKLLNRFAHGRHAIVAGRHDIHLKFMQIHRDDSTVLQQYRLAEKSVGALVLGGLKSGYFYNGINAILIAHYEQNSHETTKYYKSSASYFQNSFKVWGYNPNDGKTDNLSREETELVIKTHFYLAAIYVKLNDSTNARNMHLSLEKLIDKIDIDDNDMLDFAGAWLELTESVWTHSLEERLKELDKK
ncbi:MAG: response regulator [Fibrobacterota bacterium]